jgi:hypothetical protein
VYADAPNVEISVHQVNHVTTKCDPAGSSSDNSGTTNYTNVVPSVWYDVDLSGTGVGDHLETLGEKDMLPTQCLRYNPKTTGFADAATSGSQKTAALGKLPICALLVTAIVAVVLG